MISVCLGCWIRIQMSIALRIRMQETHINADSYWSGILDKASKVPDPQWGKELLPYICLQIRSETYASYKSQVIIFSVADPDPGSGALFDPWIRYSGKMSGSGSGMKKPDHISESSETIFGVKILKFFDADPGSGMGKNRIRDGKNSDPG